MKSTSDSLGRLSRAQAKVRTRQLLLDAAASTFAHKGFSGASVDEIAEAAGFSVGALYSNFARKEDLFLELMASRGGGRLAEAVQIVGDDKRTVEQRRQALGRLLVEIADQDADSASLQAEFWLYAVRRPEFRRQVSLQFGLTRDALSEVLAKRAQDRGRSTNTSFEALATILLTLFQGLIQLRRTDSALVPEELFGTAVRLLLNGAFERHGEE